MISQNPIFRSLCAREGSPSALDVDHSGPEKDLPESHIYYLDLSVPEKDLPEPRFIKLCPG